MGLAAALAAAAAPIAAAERALPYWASIAAGQAMLRAGPDRGYPATWLYQRRDLPVRVVQIHQAWRRVQEQDGTTGWMLASLLSARRTAVVSGGVRAIRATPSPDAPTMWRAEPGVVGRIDHCRDGWCRIDIGGHVGFVAQGDVWGVAPGETVD